MMMMIGRASSPYLWFLCVLPDWSRRSSWTRVTGGREDRSVRIAADKLPIYQLQVRHIVVLNSSAALYALATDACLRGASASRTAPITPNTAAATSRSPRSLGR